MFCFGFMYQRGGYLGALTLYAPRMIDNTERMPGEIREEDIPSEVTFHGPMHPPEGGRAMVIDQVFLPPQMCMRWLPDEEFNHYVRRAPGPFERIYDWTGACRDVGECPRGSLRE
jgi:hypothetical protein